MDGPTLSVDETELSIEIGDDTRHEQWVAWITGTDERGKLEREVISDDHGTETTVPIETGDVVEAVFCTSSGRKKVRQHWVFYRDELVPIDFEDVSTAIDDPGRFYPDRDT